MLENHNTRLTSSEISVVWSSCQNNSLSICVLKYFLESVDDSDIQSVVQYAYDISKQNLREGKRLLQQDNQVIPVGFTDDDVSATAPRLFSDAFYLYFLKNMAKISLSVYGVALAASANPEVRNYLSQAIKTATELYNKTADTLLEKGLFVRSPYVTTSNTTDFVDKKNYLGGLINIANNNRPLNVVEITHIDANTETNTIGQVLLAGFAQVAKSKKVSNHCNTGKEIAKKHVEVFGNMLTDEDLPASAPWDLEITDSTISPFSDKLILFLSSLLIQSGISNYATAAAASFRKDIQTSYVRLATEISQYAADGLNLLIKNNWLEQPPQIPDHKSLAKD